ncbi:MAG TPA: antibiotic biosynthesis monooxygenase [Thermoanaerobaculia bacterium]|jgi:heme-degrading monooxygenase HmoA
MIARIWRGNVRADKADEYLAYVEKTGLDEYRRTPGNLGAFVLRRVENDTAEFLVVSFWEGFEAIRRFAGPHPENAVYYPEDDRYLLGKEPHVKHYEVGAGYLPDLDRSAAEVSRTI